MCVCMYVERERERERENTRAAVSVYSVGRCAANSLYASRPRAGWLAGSGLTWSQRNVLVCNYVTL